MIVRRHYLEKVKLFVGTDVVKVITGIRRSGKSVLLEQIRDELLGGGKGDTEVVYLNLEDRANAALFRAEALHERLAGVLAAAKGRRVAILLDEINDVEGWETAINSIRLHSNADLYLTGSNSKAEAQAETAVKLGPLAP